ncbi:putative bifunctional diguanylate cyclase/phosphodiesterase [Clostridium uliginosum]|uniref:Diguanylate cyclase (GGDEF) domain-containing protein n=1 Tax=Clostridium uliginosum TaxID=119641 RepID=A0A1I1N631_9CLOT|nr:bifunctional diguanylate cyclase/phosphodiesterase [Clostridium uliginosum]SFC90958.1 diguanylate cyclase (GGDEF) domain-containing protein [Clostridium uliginosum]
MSYFYKNKFISKLNIFEKRDLEKDTEEFKLTNDIGVSNIIFILSLLLIIMGSSNLCKIIATIGILFAFIFILKKEKKIIENIKFTDDLTGAKNLKKFKIDLKEILKTHKKSDFTIIQFDIDNFKYVNDIFGYEEGNKTLKNIAKVLKFSLADNEFFARIDSDRFIILMNYKNDSDIIIKLEYLIYKFNRYNKDKSKIFNLIFSFGIYKILDKDNNIENIIDLANISRKTIKGLYKNQYAFYNNEIREQVFIENEIENSMYYALENKEFEVYLQPKYDLQKTQMVGAEALIRWIHPKKGLILPNDFIPLFEKNGFVINIDFFVLEEVCKKMSEWIDKGLNPVVISINQSRLHINNHNYIEMVKSIINKYNIPPELIELEITENIFFDNINLLIDVVEELHNIGIRISMDDFGSGYSSLNLLNNIPLDVLKIDKSFLKDITENERSKIVITKVIEMAKCLKMTVISEGVETEKQAEFLRGIGCDMVQGFLFDRPMPIEEFEKKFFLT